MGVSRWVPQQSGGLFKKGNALVVEAQTSVAEGEVITMDFGAFPEEKLDSQVLLDYGTMDVDRSQVRHRGRLECRMSVGTEKPCPEHQGRDLEWP